MGVLGERTKSNKLMWGTTPYDDRLEDSGWSETASDEFGPVFILFYNNTKKGVYLYDMNDDVTYEVPYGTKAKGYMLAFKLFTR